VDVDPIVEELVDIVVVVGDLQVRRDPVLQGNHEVAVLTILKIGRERLQANESVDWPVVEIDRDDRHLPLGEPGKGEHVRVPAVLVLCKQAEKLPPTEGRLGRAKLPAVKVVIMDMLQTLEELLAFLADHRVLLRGVLQVGAHVQRLGLATIQKVHAVHVEPEAG